MSGEDDVRNLPGLKLPDLQTKCISCGKGVGHTGSPMFYRLRLETYLLDGRAIQRQHGLEQFCGGGSQGATLAHVMGDGQDLAKCVSTTTWHLLCLDCALGNATLCQALEERP